MANQNEKKYFRYKLSSADKRKVLDGSKLNDCHVDLFHQMLRLYSQKIPPTINPQSTLITPKIMRIPGREWIKPVPYDSIHIQILHSCDDLCRECTGGHWICCYYDKTNIHIYDSLNRNQLHPCNEQFLNQLFPYLIKKKL